MAFVEGDGPGATRAKGYPAVYLDAVGDLDKVGLDAKGRIWGPSCSHFQIRCLHNFQDYPEPDRSRVASEIHDDPVEATRVAVALMRRFGWGLWSAWKSGSYLAHKGRDFTLVTGHPRAAQWNA